MITVQDIDRLVVSNDAVAARLWARLGPRVRRAYMDDRDGWVVLRRRVEDGATLPSSTLAAQHKAFSGWARAFRAAAASHRKPSPGAKMAHKTTPGAAAAAAPLAPVAAPVAVAAPPSSPPAIPPLAAVVKAKGGAGTAVAGGLVLAGLIAIAARRKHP